MNGYIINTKHHFTVVKPTNTTNLCIIYGNKDSSSRGWQPNADDLTSDSWSAITQEEFLEFCK